MAVIEYMLYRVNGGSRKEIPGFVGDRGHWMSPIDGTFIGWIDDVRDYYVPDTVEILSREQFIARQLAIHAQYPFTDESDLISETPPTALTNQQVTDQMGAWYDAFVTKNSD
jgi:hypothetical protein